MGTQEEVMANIIDTEQEEFIKTKNQECHKLMNAVERQSVIAYELIRKSQSIRLSISKITQENNDEYENIYKM